MTASSTYGPYSLEPVDVARVDTPHRRIVTPLPVPESLEIFERLQRFEPPSMACQPPVVWDHAEGCQVHDRWGNRWLDWSSGVLLANVGHAHPKITRRLAPLLERGQLATYVFAHEERAELVARLAALAPPGLDHVFLLTTGSEAVECTIKLARTWGQRRDPQKRVIVSFHGAFHGRTLGSQLAGGIEALKAWVGKRDGTFVQVPFPDGYLADDTSFGGFERALSAQGVEGRSVAGVLAESYLGIGPDFFPREYAQELRRWCDAQSAVLIFDEVQAAFGRTGRMFNFEHYGIVPDLIACGKGISSSLPLAAVIGREELLSLYPPGAMTSTHSGSPLCAAAGLGSLDALEEDGLIAHADALSGDMVDGLDTIAAAFGQRVGCVRGRGLVGGVRVVHPSTKDPDPHLARAIVLRCFQKGLLFFSPVGLGGGCLKIAPPLSIPREALAEGFEVLAEAFEEALR